MKRVSLKTDEKISLFDNMSTMLAAGIPILEVVETLLTDAKGNPKKVYQQLKKDLTAGKKVSKSLSNFPDSFDEVTVNLIKAAEEAGTLEETLIDVKKSIKREAKFMDSVKAAAFYPALISVVFLAVVLVMLIVVIPRISKVFTSLDVNLPLPTKILIATSNFLFKYWPFVIAFIIFWIIFSILFYRRKKRMILGVFFSLPIIKGLIKQIDISRFSRSLHLLLSAGIPIPQAVYLSNNVVLLPNMRRLINNALAMSKEGHPLSKGFKKKQYDMPVMMVKLMEVGEKSGNLDKAMQDVANHMEYEVDKNLKQITTLLEPILLVTIAVAIGGMMISIIAPIYNLISQVQVR